MYIQPFVDEGLGNSSYLIASEAVGLAAVIDPLRDVDRYVQTAEGLGLRLAYVLDTHLHADFVSGARELQAQLGVTIGASADAHHAFDYLPLSEGHAIALGDICLEVISTPGHTPEHITFMARPAGAATPEAIFSGGALIVGGAARTDLISHDLTEPLARRLYHTIHDKLMHLPDSVSVYPTHGAGSFCVAPSTKQRITTIGQERLGNPLAQAQSEAEFVRLALTGLPSYPTYYQYLRPINQRGPRLLGGVPVLLPLSPDEVWLQVEQGTAVLDARRKEAVWEGYIPGSYTIALNAPLITWAGWLIPFGAPLILLAETPAEQEKAARQLIRIGYDDLRGYLDGGIDGWAAANRPVARAQRITVKALRERLADGDAPRVLDVRHDSEWFSGHIPGAIHVENGRLPDATLPFSPHEPIAVHCQAAARATAALSILNRRGYGNVMLIEGGFRAWEAAGYEIA